MSRGALHLTLPPCSAWCDNGHVRPLGVPACPTCRVALAEVAGELVERLNLGLIAVLEVGSPLGRMHRQVGG